MMLERVLAFSSLAILALAAFATWREADAVLGVLP